MTFPKRPKKSKRLDWSVKEWHSTDGGYRITLASIAGLTPVYRANVYCYDGGRAYWGKLSNHRKLAAAIRACEDHARGQT